MKWKRLIIEAKTPSDVDSINASFDKDVSDEKFTPTVEFMKVVYNKMNKEFFFNYLPNESEIKFIVKSLGRDREVGSSPYMKNMEKHELTPKAIVLNSSFKLTSHGWMEAILHEMLHVSDYLINPDKFYGSTYDPHGDWFLKQGKRFRKHGFNVTKYCDLEIEIDEDPKEDADMIDNDRNIFLVFKKKGSGGKSMCVRIEVEDKDKAMDFLSKQGIRKAFLLSTGNSFSDEVDVWHPNEQMNTMDFNDTTITLYGPFKREELLDVSNPISESEEDDLDKYMKIARTIKGVTKVYRKGDEVIVWLS